MSAAARYEAMAFTFEAVRRGLFAAQSSPTVFDYCCGAICAGIVALIVSPWSMTWAFVFLALGCRHAMKAKQEARALASDLATQGQEK